MTKFFIINPEKDRRYEGRFESFENVVVRIENTGQTFPAKAFDIGHFGLKLETHDSISPLYSLQIAFPNSPDHTRCFARAVWSREVGHTQTHETGVSVQSWLGIIAGDKSWEHHAGFRPKKDRRLKHR